MRNNTDRGMWLGVSEYARIQIVYMKKSEQRMLGNGSFVRRNRSGGSEGTERLYEGSGTEDGSNDLFVWDNRPVINVQPLRPLCRNGHEGA